MSAFEDKMEQLRARFRLRAASERDLLTRALNDGDRDEIRRIAHGLAGTAGVFGYGEISRDALMLEEAVDSAESLAKIQMLGAELIARLDAAQED